MKISKKDAMVASIVLIANAYFIITYDMFRDSLKSFFNYPNVIIYAIAGLMALAFGLFVLWVLIKPKE